MNGHERNKSGNPNELDARFPSGPWHGFFLQREYSAGQVLMTMTLEFRGGVVRGSGTDPVGEFAIFGRYGVDSGDVTLQKRYLGQHTVFYRGFAEGDGIWGLWQIPGVPRGGFHIRPGKLPAAQEDLAAEADLEPVTVFTKLVTADS